MAVKKNIFIDITFLITFMTFFVYTSGNAYIGGFTRYFGYKEGALGLTLQEYFMFGGLNGLTGIFLIFFSLLCISLINVLCDKNIHISMLKGTLYAILFPFLFTYNWIKHYYIIPPKILVGILYYKQKIKEKFKRKSSDRFSIKILLNIISDQTHNIIKKSINWDSKVDFKNIDQGIKEVIRYYFYLIILYLVIISILFFFIDMEKTGLHDAKERIQIEDHELPIKDEIIDMHLNKIYKNIPYPLKGKVLECGTTNCLVAINVENFIYKGKSPQIHKKYIVKPIKNDGYINQINSFQDLPEI